MSITNALAGIAVKDLEQAIAWYTKLLGRRPDERPMPNDAEYRFDRGGWAQIFFDEKRAGKSSITFVVDGVDGEVERLRGIGIAVDDPHRSDYVDTVILQDPDGNQVVLAQGRSEENEAAS